MGAMSSFLRTLNTEATLRTLREKLRPRPRPGSLQLVVSDGARRGGVRVVGLVRLVRLVGLSDLPMTRTGSSAAVMVFRRR
jgi:hypothetical protein